MTRGRQQPGLPTKYKPLKKRLNIHQKGMNIIQRKKTTMPVDSKPLENCNDAKKPSTVPLCPMKYGAWKWTKISELQQNIGPVLDYRWEGFAEYNLLKSGNHSYDMKNNYWHASILAKPGVLISIKIEQTSQTYRITLDNGNNTSRISTMYLCTDVFCTNKRELKHYKQGAVLNEKKWIHISIELNPGVPNGGTDLTFLRNGKEILKHQIKDLQLSSAVDGKRATITLNPDFNSRLKIHDYYVIHTSNDSETLTLHNLPAGCWQYLYYGDIAVSHVATDMNNSGTQFITQGDKLGWRTKSYTFHEQSNVTFKTENNNQWTIKFWAFGDFRKCEENAWHVSKIEGVKTSETKKITCTSLRTESAIGAATDPDPIARTTPIPPTTPASANSQSSECSDKGFWFWMAVVSLCILIFGLLVALFVIMVWNHGYPWKRKEEPFYRRRGSLLSGVRRAPVVAPATTEIEMRHNNNNRQQRTYDPAPDRGNGDKQGLVFSNSERGVVATPGLPPEPSSSGMLISVPRSRAPPIPTDVQNLAPLPQRSPSKSPAHSTTSRPNSSKQCKKPAPLPDEIRWEPSTSNASDNTAFQYENGNVKTNGKMEKKRVVPLPPIEPPKYGNFKMTVVDEPIFGNKGPIPVKLDPIYGNFGESESLHDPIYGNF